MRNIKVTKTTIRYLLNSFNLREAFSRKNEHCIKQHRTLLLSPVTIISKTMSNISGVKNT